VKKGKCSISGGRGGTNRERQSNGKKKNKNQKKKVKEKKEEWEENLDFDKVGSKEREPWGFMMNFWHLSPLLPEHPFTSTPEWRFFLSFASVLGRLRIFSC